MASTVVRRPSLFAGQQVVMATKHGKERMVSLPLRLGLGINLIVPEGVDTDTLGTFTGEIPRVGSPLETAIRKARLGMDAVGTHLGLASEGSFGPDPLVPFLPVNHELLVFVDDERGLIVVERNVTTDTNFDHADVDSIEDLGRFLRRARFPSHALIVRPRVGGDPGDTRKGITSLPELERAIDRATQRSADGLAHIETDMRAHLNPTRARVIRRLAFALTHRLRSHCPACDSPGWGRVDVVPGLPCAWCGTPTDFIHFEVLGCARCDHRDQRPRSDGLLRAEPDHCPRCNP